MYRFIAVGLLLTGSLFAQLPKNFYAWWNKPVIARALNLSAIQQRQIRQTVVQFRPRLIDIRGAVNKAEQDLETQFNSDPVDQVKANEAIEHLIAARSDLTRTLSQLSLRLRLVLNEQQWQSLQRLRPLPGDDKAPPDVSGR